MRSNAVEIAAHVFVVIAVLPPGPLLCRVVRHLGITVLTVDPRATKLEVHDYCAQMLTRAENNRLREACGQPACGQPMDDAMMEGLAMTADELPADLRWPPARVQDGLRQAM